MNDPVFLSKPILERFKLDGRTALVTGGGQGIGRAFCHALAEAGARVAVVDVNRAAAETVADELAKKRLVSLAIAADVTNPDQVRSMVDSVVSHWGTLTIGVNNAGIGDWLAAEEVTRERWDRVLSLNLDAVFFCAQAEARVMFPNKYGKIINTASMSGHIVNAPQNQSSYNISKAGVIHLTRSLAAEWADRGIRVNSISPGYTWTMLVEKLVSTPEGKAIMDQWMPRIPMKRMAEVSELQGAAVYLAAEASDYMTGHDLVIDGGYCLW
ncbi:MAG: glucose 1-dehydrogenase [Spirochaetia bacterium]|jgi:NAD(P)-dependent dehydrogenase (short-subunit alcohol dehydrogenase family)